MKKAFLLGLVMLSTVALSGCEMIEGLLKGGEDLINEKKDYTYDDFAVLLADKGFTWSYTKCSAIVEKDGEKSSIDYTYNKEDKLWHYTSGDNDKTSSLDIISFVKSCKLNAALLNKSVDSVYKFSASKNGYLITANFKNSEYQVDGEYNYNTEGLVTSENEKQTNLSTVAAITRKVTYSYFE